jgi:integrase
MAPERRRGRGEGGIRQRPDGLWEGRVTLGYVNGRRARRSVYGQTRKEVVDKLVPLLALAQRGDAPAAGGRRLDAFLEEWIAALGMRVRPATARRYAELLRLHVVPSLGPVKLSRVTPQRVEALLTEKLGERLSPRTVWHIRAVLRAALTDAVRAGEVSRNAAALARPPRVEGYQVEPMTPARAAEILDAVAGSDLEAPISLALWTGLRQGELLGLRWSDVDLEGRRLAVNLALHGRHGQWFLETTKTPKSRRTIDLPDPAAEALAAHRQRQLEQRLLVGPEWDTRFGDLVFTDPVGRPIDGRNLTQRFQTILRGAELPRIRFHDLRHAAATLMLASGTDLKVVSEILGHSAIGTTANVYAGVLDQLKADAAVRLARLVRPRGW